MIQIRFSGMLLGLLKHQDYWHCEAIDAINSEIQSKTIFDRIIAV